jgi:hypothetical protein
LSCRPSHPGDLGVGDLVDRVTATPAADLHCDDPSRHGDQQVDLAALDGPIPFQDLGSPASQKHLGDAFTPGAQPGPAA